MPAQKVEKVAVEGQVVKVEHKSGDFTASGGDRVEYDYHEVKLLTPDYEVVVVRITRNGPVSLPAVESQARYICDARAASGNIKLTAESQDRYTYAELLALLEVARVS
jgi:hypothetical protein